MPIREMEAPPPKRRKTERAERKKDPASRAYKDVRRALEALDEEKSGSSEIAEAVSALHQAEDHLGAHLRSR